MNNKIFFKRLAIAGFLFSSVALNLTTTAKASSTLEIGRNADGRMEAIAVGKNQVPYFRYQTAPDGGWSNWIQTPLPNGNKVKQVEVAQNVDGTMVRFAIAQSGEVFFQYQTRRNSRMTGWKTFHLHAEELEVGKNADGRLEVFAIEKGTKNVYHRWQTQVNRPSFANWARMGGKAIKLEVAQNKDRRMELFAINERYQLVHRFQTGPNRPFHSSWYSLGLEASDVEIGTNKDGRFEVFATRKSDGRLLNKWQTGPNAPLSARWNDLGKSVTAVETAINADGRQELFVVEKGSEKVFRRYQTAPNVGMSGWIDMRLAATEIDASLNSPSGRMEVIAVDKNGRARHQFQRSRSNSNSWNGQWHYMGNDNVLLAGNSTVGPVKAFTMSEYYRQLYVSGRGTSSRGPHQHNNAIDSTARGSNAVKALVGGRVVSVRRGTQLSNVNASSNRGYHPSLGWVRASDYNGTIVIYNSELNRTFTYLHFSGVSVTPGQQVNPGDVIGTEGSTGWSTGRHMHVHVQVGTNGSRENLLVTLGAARSRGLN